MPISRTATITSIMTGFALDVPSLSATCTFQNFIDGAAASQSVFQVVGDDLVALMQAAPVPGKTRSDDITEAIYHYAVGKGYVQGAVS